MEKGELVCKRDLVEQVVVGGVGEIVCTGAKVETPMVKGDLLGGEAGPAARLTLGTMDGSSSTRVKTPNGLTVFEVLAAFPFRC